MPWRRAVTAIVVVLLVGLLVPVAGARGGSTGGAIAGDLVEDTLNATDTGDATEETSTVEDGSGSTTEIGTDTEEASIEEVTQTASGTTETVDRVTETADATTQAPVGSTETIETAGDGGSTETATETVTATDTVSETVETVDGAAGRVDEETVNETSGTVEDTVARVTETVDGTTEIDGTGGTTTDLDETSGAVDGTVESVDETLEGTTARDAVEDVTGDVDRTADGVSETLGAVEGQLDPTTGTPVDGSTGLVTPSEWIDETSTARGSVDEVAFGSGETTASPSTVEDAMIQPNTARSGVRRGTAPGSHRHPEGALPIGGAVGVLALVAGAMAQRGAVVANGCPDVLLRGVASLRRVATFDPGTRLRLPRFLSAFRYSRFDDSDPLEHEEREELYRLIQEAPGVNLSLLAERTGVPLSTARHHLRVLQREGLVDDRKTGGKRRFVPRGTDVDEQAVALDDEATARVLYAIARRGPASVSSLAEELDRDPSTVTHHLQDLEAAALVERHREGRTVVNRLTPTARRAIVAGGDSARRDDRFGTTD